MAVVEPDFTESNVPDSLKERILQITLDLGREIMPAIDREIEACRDEIEFIENDPDHEEWSS